MGENDTPPLPRVSSTVAQVASTSRTDLETGSGASGDSEKAVHRVHAEVFETIVIQQTGGSNSVVSQHRAAAPQRAYPHLYDPGHPEGAAATHLQQAKANAELAIAALGLGEFEEIQTRFGQIAVNVAKAWEQSGFNPGLRAACTYVRRAILAASADTTELGALNALYAAVAAMSENPLMSLSEAADLVEQLSAEGWDGQNPLADELVRAWFESRNAASESITTSPQISKIDL